MFFLHISITTLLVLVAIIVVNKPVAAVPLAYEHTTVTNYRTDPGHWASYDNSVQENGTVSTTNHEDDSIRFQPLPYCFPYFQAPYAQPFISSNGFVAVVPFAMCEHFCAGGSRGEGYYKFNPQIAGGGGDWPMLGLYVHDLDPSSSGDVKYLIRKKYSDNLDVLLVEYNNVVQYTPPGTRSNTFLTAQLEVWPNGTIIFRYSKVFSYFYSSDYYYPSVGLIWSPQQGVIVETPRYRSGTTLPTITVHRFDPVPVKCSNIQSCTSCVDTEGCNWCWNLNLCVPQNIAIDFCNGADLRGNVSGCGELPMYSPLVTSDPQLLNSTSRQTVLQYFYSSKLEYGSRDRFTDLDTVADATLLPFNASFDSPVEISFPFLFPFFYSLTTEDPNSFRQTKKVYLHKSGYISVLSKLQSCVPDESGVCKGNEYSFIIAPFLSGMYFIQDETEVRTLLLEKRPTGSAFCPNENVTTLTGNNTEGCDSGIVIQVKGARGLDSFKINTLTVGPSFTFQVLLEASGVVRFFYWDAFNEEAVYNGLLFNVTSPQKCYAANVTQVFKTFPAPNSGIIRHGTEDPSSAIIPWTAIQPGMKASFYPIPGCPDCNGNGVCNMKLGKCDCLPAFSGDTCLECAPGFYGSSCMPCNECEHEGICDYGRKGSGRCFCKDPFSGSRCEIRCADTDPRPLNCSQCNAVGGYCECGKCHCLSKKGWSGEGCNVWKDPCLQWTLDGCDTCVTQTDVSCVYCIDYRCVADFRQDGISTPNTTICTAFYTVDEYRRCPHYSGAPYDNSSYILLLSVGVFIVVGLAVCTGVLFYWTLQKRKHNTLLNNATVGIPDFRPPRRDREVVQVQLLNVPSGDSLVMGIPLKQIPLAELWQHQQERREEQSRQAAIMRHRRTFQSGN